MVANLVLVRHGETEWSRTRRHTSFTDLELTDDGRRAASRLTPSLANWKFAAFLSSPRRRARETAALALPRAAIAIDDDLAEWNYGKYEGLTTATIHESFDPKWNLWTDGCPGGETPLDVATRVDRVLARLATIEGDALCFAHGHVLRVLVARWIGLPPERGSSFFLDTATLSVLGHEHSRQVVVRWNEHAARGS